jgi:hypothetical protein
MKEGTYSLPRATLLLIFFHKGEYFGLILMIDISLHISMLEYTD